jgi:hypothetical protein
VGFSSPKIGIWMIWWKIRIENGIWSWNIGIKPTQILRIKKPFSFQMKFQATKLWAWQKLMGFDQPKGVESTKVGSWALGLNQNYSNSTCKTSQETRNRRILAERKKDGPTIWKQSRVLGNHKFSASMASGLLISFALLTRIERSYNLQPPRS